MTECYKVGAFTDAFGNKRKFVVCGSIHEQKDELVLASITAANKFGLPGKACIPVKESDGDGHIRSGIFLGVAVCSAEDTFDEATGRKIALSRSLNGNHHQRWIHTDFPEIFDEKILQQVVDRWAHLVSTEPEKYAPGYAYKKETSNVFDNLSAPEQLIVEALRQGSLDIVRMSKIINGMQESAPGVGLG